MIELKGQTTKRTRFHLDFSSFQNFSIKYVKMSKWKKKFAKLFHPVSFNSISGGRYKLDKKRTADWTYKYQTEKHRYKVIMQSNRCWIN